MPAVPTSVLISVVTDAIRESGFIGQLASGIHTHPKRFVVVAPTGSINLSVYIWTLTFGGRPALANEYRIQMTSVGSPLRVAENGPTVLMGYEPTLRLFAGFDLIRHRTFTGGSPSVQIDRTVLQRAETEGLSFHRKSNDEIAVGIRPDMFMAYCMNADLCTDMAEKRMSYASLIRYPHNISLLRRRLKFCPQSDNGLYKR